MATSNAECSQWLSVTEETLFLHDGLLRVTDLVELPEGVENCGSKDNEVVSFDTKIPEELSTKLIELCTSRNNSFNTLQEYRLNALKGLWRAQKLLGQDEQGERESNQQQDDAISLLKKQGLIKDSDQASFSTRISLLLILPLLQSQSKTDPELCAVTSGVILTCLKDCPPLSLAKEPSDCLIGLESLLCGWLGEKNIWCTQSKDKKHQENAAAALVALACARGFVKTFIHAVHLLQQLQEIPPLPVGNVLASLLECEGGGHCQVSSFQGARYILSWGVDDLLGPAVPDSGVEESKDNSDKEKEQDIGRSIATDGCYLYTTNSSGRGISKLGTGRRGTLRGYVYCKNIDIGPGRLAYASEALLFRPQSYDQENNVEYLAQLIDTNSLQPLKSIIKSLDMLSYTGPVTTVSFCSDGICLYWLWCPALVSDKSAKGINVNVTSFTVEKSLEVVPVQPLIILQKKEDTSQKGMNEALLTRLRPLRVSNSAATLMAFTGTDTIVPNRKEEAAPGLGSTSCGVLLKTLVKTPIYCDGNHLVMLTQPVGGAAGASARSLFGGGGSIQGMRALASNMCFNTKTGYFTARVDLADAATSSVGRGTLPTCVGSCFDVENNLLWLSSGEYVDVFHNPGNLAPHHIHRRLGIGEMITPEALKDSSLVPINTVIMVLLQNVGSMCLHQMTGELYPLNSYSPINGREAEATQTALDFEHLNRVMDILARAVSDQDGQAIICCLVVLQLMFKTSRYKNNEESTDQHIKNARSLIFKLLTDEPLLDVEGKLKSLVKTEASRVITLGLRSLYSSYEDRQRLLYDLLTSGKEHPSLVDLRDSILTDLAGQLNRQQAPMEDIGILQLSDDLVSFVLKLAVKESCVLLKEVQTFSKDDLQERLSNLPVLSPSVLYLTALRSYLLRCAILHESINGKHEAVQNLTGIQDSVLSLVSKMIEGACQVLESFIETCVSVLNTCVNGDLEHWLAAFERLAKSTILGTLMPVLITALTHSNLQCLSIAQALMPSLVRLTLFSSRAVLLMKSEELEASTQLSAANDVDLSADREMADMIGEVFSCDLESGAEEEEGFLTGLKIPAPWASGKTVETIHPVRDNYKFKETVHIPGARCLYLRFDPRCSSQYDYDKVVIYAGPSVNGKKIVEYGGNSYGFGSRSVLGSGWPKDLVKVEGDTVTVTFEMRSGREHNTPDKAMWGFACTIRAQESAEEESPGLPFLSDLALGLSVLLSTYLSLLYHGSHQTQDEMDCQHLLKSRLLQRCVWTFEKGGDKPVVSGNQPMAGKKGRQTEPTCTEGVAIKEVESSTTTTAAATTATTLAHIKLPKDILVKLRKLTRWQPPHIKPSVVPVLQLAVIEERAVSAIAKHLGLDHSVCHLGKLVEQQQQQGEQPGEELAALKAIMEETYRKFDILARQLQVMADLEKMWHIDVEDNVSVEKADSGEDSQMSPPTDPPFFHDYHLRETCHKDLATIAFLKDVTMETDMEAVVNNLLEKFNRDVEELKVSKAKLGDNNGNNDGPSTVLPKEIFSKTKQVVSGILSRLDLLLHVNSVSFDAQSALTRTLSYTQGFKEDFVARSDTDVSFAHFGFGRSMSAPVGIDESSIFKQHRWRQAEKQRRMASILQDLVDDGDEDKPPHIIVIDQLFAFIGNDPLKMVSSAKFLKAAEERYRRGCSRKEALNHIKELLSSAAKIGGATHLIAAVSSVIRYGPKVDDLVCGGMVTEVRDVFAEAMSAVVQLAARYPIHSASSIGLLCTIPYTRAEEKCLVRSGLVHLLDNLCGLGNHRVSGIHAEMQTPGQKVSALAWAGFQVLASRCVKWEVEDGSQVEELEHSGLAKQVSMLLTHHLARATEGIGNAMAGTEALQEVLSLLNNLSRSRMGKAILSQPACVSKLLSLLLDQRPSPKLVLIILQLCRVSLPLMNCEDCQEVELPTWAQQLSTHWSSGNEVSDPPARIISLLLAKLGDFLVPGEQVLLSCQTSQESTVSGRASKLGDVDKGEDSDVLRGKLSVFVHKRNDQTSHEVIQPLLTQENRPFRLVGTASVDKVVRLDREISKNGKAELTTEEAVSAFRKAYKWAQLGLVVSLAPPSDTSAVESSGSDKKKATSEVICKEKNSELLRTDPIRAFISGHVANAMAAEVIALLHNLLSTHVSSSAQTWSQAVQRVLANALSGLPMLLSSLEGLSSPRTQSNIQLMSIAKLANASLCALGGFSETIKPGCEVKVTGEGVSGTRGTVVSVSEQNDVVTIQLDDDKRDNSGGSAEDKDYHSPPPTYSEIIKVPITRVKPIRNELFTQYQRDMSEALLSTVKAVILPSDESTSPLSQPLYSMGDANSLANQISRVMAEIRTRTSIVLAQYLQDIDFAKKFIDHCGCSIDMLKSMAKECNTGSRQPVIEAHCQRLRMLYRDCAKPPPPPCRTDIRPTKEMMWDVVRPFPPARACLFSQSMTGVMFLGDPSAGIGLPRGTMVYANQPIPKEAPSFYWELEIISFGDTQAESGAVVSFGFAPPAEKKDGAWTNPVGTCLFLNTGKAVHYNGASLLQWRSVRLEITLNAGDVAGIGWERTGESSDSNQVPKGQVYFTHNGEKLAASLDSVSGAMYPVVHIQKKNCRVKANFGARPFAFAEGQQHRDAAEAANDVLRDIRESFGHLPFHSTSDSESDTAENTRSATQSDSNRDSKSPPKIPCKLAEPPVTLKEYDIEASQGYKLLPCNDNFILTGPDSFFSCPMEEESDEETVVDDSGSEDHYALLVKAWEQKVFPVIRRRFRNEAERKDGLEQIRGALQLGMTDIARQTVEFLYEENGGIPRDLHLPTIDDIKEDLAKFTIDRVKKGTTVNIRTPVAPSSNNATTQLPKFAVRSMLRTFGLTGTVLDVDSANECVQVEAYLRSEGVLVRFWYPLVMLEKPVQGMRKASITGGQTMDTSNILIHRELLSTEALLSRMHLRNAFLRLTDHCNSPAMEVASCSSSLGSGMAVCASTLQELDLENIQLLSEQLLMSPYTTGTLEAQSPFQTPSLSQLLATQQVSLTDIVYRDGLRLKRELATAIARASDQGEDYLIELTNQLCMCLQTAPESFPFMTFPVNESKVSTDVHFPGAACILVSCLKNSDATNKESPPYRAPWARLSTYTGKRIKKCGQVTKQKVVCYPRDVHSLCQTSDQFAPAIIPGDRLYVKIGVSPPPGITITLHALPPQFLLAVAYIETLVTETFGCGIQACGRVGRGEMSTSSQIGDEDKDKQHAAAASRFKASSFMSSLSTDEISNPSLWSLENITVTPVVFLHLLEFLCGYLWKTDTPALLKEYLFHLLAQTIRILHCSENSECSYLLKPESRFSPTHRLLNSLHRELKTLYKLESKTMAKMTTPAGSGIGLGVTDSGRFSTYFHALMEVCLAIFEVVPIEISVDKEVVEGLLEDNSMAAATSIAETASGSLTCGKKKRLKAKKERTAISTRRSSSSEQRAAMDNLLDADGSLTSSALTLSSQADDQLSQSSAYVSSGSSPLFHQASSGFVASESSTSQLSSSLKSEDMAWFTRAVSISKILHYLALKEYHCFPEVKKSVSCAANSLSPPTAHSRLLVITGIPPYLDLMTVKKSIRKVCNGLGGLDRDEIFIPISTSKKTTAETTAATAVVTSLAASKSLTESVNIVEPLQSDSSNNSRSDPSMDSSSSSSSTSSPKTETLTASTSNESGGSGVGAVGSHPKTKSKLIEGNAVISIPSKTKIELVRRAFLKTKWLNLNSVDDPDSPEAPDENLNVHTVNQSLLTEPEANSTLESYLRFKLLQGNDSDESEVPGIGKVVNQILTEIFYSCFFLDQQQDSGDICLSHEQILNLAPENLLAVFFNNVRPSKKPLPEAVMSVLRQYGCQRTGDKQRSPTSSDRSSKGKGVKKTSVRSHKEKQVLGMVEKGAEKQHPKESEEKKDREEKLEEEKVEKSSSPKDGGRKEGATAANVPVKESKSASKMESRLLTLEGFMLCCSDLAHQDLRSLWKGLFACGFDLHLERCACPDLSSALQMMTEWSLEKDAALVHFVNESCRQLSVSSARLHPHEIRLSEANLSSEAYFCLQGIPPESIRLRFAFLQNLNNSLESFFLPLVDLKSGKIYSQCTSYVLSQLRSLMFYDTKVNYFNRILNASAKRKPDQAAPEITLNPIESIGTGEKDIQSSILCQSYRQLASINSKNFCVRLACGGDPTYSFNVRMTGEEVHGNSGSFRHYLWQVARELQSTTTGLLISGPNKGRWLIMPGQMTFSEENLLVFLGQLLGITIRADIPLGLDLLPTVWKLLVGLTLDPSVDLKQADPVTYGYIKRIEMAETESELESIVGEGEASCLFPSLTGCDINVMQGSISTPTSWSHRQEYMDAIKELRMRELTCPWRMQAVCTGLSSVIPYQLLHLMTPWDLEMRTSGRTHISLDFLKAHTMYQVGLVESDPHIEHFWSALESLSQEELARFVKFACNQERIPQTCPCQEGGPDSAHVPPYPMKIAPPDGSGPPDSRYIRVETCMFMVKLPQYSSYEVMLQKLLYAINCREDPLSG